MQPLRTAIFSPKPNFSTRYLLEYLLLKICLNKCTCETPVDSFFLIYEKAVSKVTQQSMCTNMLKSVVHSALYLRCDIKGNPANLQVTNEK